MTLGRAAVQVRVEILWHGTLGSKTGLLGETGLLGKPFSLVAGRFQMKDVHFSHGGGGRRTGLPRTGSLSQPIFESSVAGCPG